MADRGWAELTGPWLRYQEAQGRAESTVELYERVLKRIIKWYEDSGIGPGEVSKNDINDWRRRTRERVAPATFATYCSVHSSFFLWMRSEEVIDFDPGPLLRRPKVVQVTSPEHLKPREVTRLRHVLHARNGGFSVRDQALVELLLCAGLRISEALALQVQDITISERAGSVVVRKGKGGVSRKLPLTSKVRDYLKPLLEERTSGFVFVSSQPGPGGPQPIHRTTAQRVLTKLGGMIKVKLHPHKLRHTFAFRMRDKGARLEATKDLMGHASIKTTAIYTKHTNEELAELMERPHGEHKEGD